MAHGSALASLNLPADPPWHYDHAVRSMPPVLTGCRRVIMQPPPKHVQVGPPGLEYARTDAGDLDLRKRLEEQNREDKTRHGQIVFEDAQPYKFRTKWDDFEGEDEFANDSVRTLQFESRFESGNLQRAIKVGPTEYDLYLRPDKGTGCVQWYYFMVRNMKVRVPYVFNIVNFVKKKSLYNSGLRPLMYSDKEARSKRDGTGWHRVGSSCAYYQKGYRYALTFTLTFKYDEDTCYFAHCYPYTYTDSQLFLSKILRDPERRASCKRRELCRSLVGNVVDLLEISDNVHDETSAPKPSILLSARVHPGETQASWAIQSCIDFLTSSLPEARLLRSRYTIFVVPMLNPDGVINGHYRSSMSGKDLNRVWSNPHKRKHPCIWYLKNLVRELSSRSLTFFCDFHGHSVKKNVFMYGCNDETHKPGDRDSKVTASIAQFPLLLKEVSQAFSFEDCNFLVQRGKVNTGRVVVNRDFGVSNSYTIEISFLGHEVGGQMVHFKIADIEKIGHEFGVALVKYHFPNQYEYELPKANNLGNPGALAEQEAKTAKGASLWPRGRIEVLENTACKQKRPGSRDPVLTRGRNSPDELKRTGDRKGHRMQEKFITFMEGDDEMLTRFVKGGVNVQRERAEAVRLSVRLGRPCTRAPAPFNSSALQRLVVERSAEEEGCIVNNEVEEESSARNLTHYERLGIRPPSHTKEIKLAYLERAKACHPDIHGEGKTAEFHELKNAYQVLSDPQSKASYDWSLSAGCTEGNPYCTPCDDNVDHCNFIRARRPESVAQKNHRGFIGIADSNSDPMTSIDFMLPKESSAELEGGRRSYHENESDEASRSPTRSPTMSALIGQKGSAVHLGLEVDSDAPLHLPSVSQCVDDCFEETDSDSIDSSGAGTSGGESDSDSDSNIDPEVASLISAAKVGQLKQRADVNLTTQEFLEACENCISPQLCMTKGTRDLRDSMHLGHTPWHAHYAAAISAQREPRQFGAPDESARASGLRDCALSCFSVADSKGGDCEIKESCAPMEDGKAGGDRNDGDGGGLLKMSFENVYRTSAAKTQLPSISLSAGAWQSCARSRKTYTVDESLETRVSKSGSSPIHTLNAATFRFAHQRAAVDISQSVLDHCKQPQVPFISLDHDLQRFPNQLGNLDGSDMSMITKDGPVASSKQQASALHLLPQVGRQFSTPPKPVDLKEYFQAIQLNDTRSTTLGRSAFGATPLPQCAEMVGHLGSQARQTIQMRAQASARNNCLVARSSTPQQDVLGVAVTIDMHARRLPQTLAARSHQLQIKCSADSTVLHPRNKKGLASITSRRSPIPMQKGAPNDRLEISTFMRSLERADASSAGLNLLRRLGSSGLESAQDLMTTRESRSEQPPSTALVRANTWSERSGQIRSPKLDKLRSSLMQRDNS